MSIQEKLRRIALDQQGLLKNKPFGNGQQAVLRALQQLAYVQIDTISVVERAHHHILWSRIPHYQPGFLEKLVASRAVFEYWFHAASWLPMRDYRFALPRMQAIKEGERHWFENSDKKLMRHILDRVRGEGPLRTRDFADTRQGKKEWWDWKPAKQALEQLFMQGELMASGREGFQKIYDIPERVLPEWVDTRKPSLDEYANHLIDATLQAHGFATQKTMTYLRKGRALREAVSKQLQQRVDAKQLEAISLAANTTAYIDAEKLATRAPRSSATAKILSPFDNLLIQRERARTVFAFDYQIECYVPAPKRQFGYFCLPILYRDQLVGRVDCKAHRKEKRLELKSLYIEKPVDDGFSCAIAATIIGFARFNQCDEITLTKTRPTHWRNEIKMALATDL